MSKKCFATITLELFKKGMYFSCEDIDIEEFIPHGDGNKLMELINHVEGICHPDSTFVLTEEGEKYLEELEKEENL